VEGDERSSHLIDTRVSGVKQANSMAFATRHSWKVGGRCRSWMWSPRVQTVLSQATTSRGRKSPEFQLVAQAQRSKRYR